MFILLVSVIIYKSWLAFGAHKMLGTKWCMILSQHLVHIEAWLFCGFHSHTGCNTVLVLTVEAKSHPWMHGVSYHSLSILSIV